MRHYLTAYVVLLATLVSANSPGNQLFSLRPAAAAPTTTASTSQEWSIARKGLRGQDLNTVFFLDTKNGWVAGDRGIVLHTEDGGITWGQQPVSTNDSINDLFFRDSDNGFLLAGNHLFRTENGGVNWRDSVSFAPSSFAGLPELYSLRFLSKKVAWMIGSISTRDRVIDSLVLVTTDGGVSWQRRIVPTRRELIHLDFSGEKQGWIVGSSGTVLYTPDGGTSWRLQRSNTTATLYHVNFRNNEIGCAVGERGAIIRTIDGGRSWRPAISPPVRGSLLSVRLLGDDQGWIVGRNGIILVSKDDGRTWLWQESPAKENFFALFADKKRCWAVGSNGIVLRYERPQRRFTLL